MSRHVTYRGATLDMDSIRRENEKVPAIGNMDANAKGDRIKNGMVTKTSDEIAREHGRVQSVLLKTGLKGAMPASVEEPIAKPVTKTTPAPAKVTKEVELPSGDIIIEDVKDEKK